MRITFARRSGPTLMWSLFLGCAHNKVRSWFYPFDLTWLLQCRAVPADHGVRDVREAFDALEGAEDETILLLQLLQRWRLGMRITFGVDQHPPQMVGRLERRWHRRTWTSLLTGLPRAWSSSSPRESFTGTHPHAPHILLLRVFWISLTLCWPNSGTLQQEISWLITTRTPRYQILASPGICLKRLCL